MTYNRFRIYTAQALGLAGILILISPLGHTMLHGLSIKNNLSTFAVGALFITASLITADIDEYNCTHGRMGGVWDEIWRWTKVLACLMVSAVVATW